MGMKKDNVKLGQTYVVKVSGMVQPVRMDAKNAHGGWDGTNMKTKKPVRVKSAARLRGLWPTKTMPITEDAKPAADVGPTATPAAEAKPKTKKEPMAAKPPRASLLNLAAEYLKINAEGTCQQMVAHALSQGWTTSGKTPEATLYSAIHGEIKKKGTASRFAKTGRGTFALAQGK